MKKIVLALTTVLAMLTFSCCHDDKEEVYPDGEDGYRSFAIQFLDKAGNNLGEQIEVMFPENQYNSPIKDYYTIEGTVNGGMDFGYNTANTRVLPPWLSLIRPEKALQLYIYLGVDIQYQKQTVEMEFCCPKIWGDEEKHLIVLEKEEKEEYRFVQWDKVVVDGEDVTDDTIESPTQGTIYRYVVKSAR